VESLPVGDPLEGDRQIEQLIYPTGQCFDDAIELLVSLLTEEHVPPAQLKLVHAICLMPGEASRFAHAWVERDGECLFVGIYQGERVRCTTDRALYYRKLRVQERTKYTPQQAAHESARTSSCGPWKQRYLALTHDAPARGEGDAPDPLHLV